MDCINLLGMGAATQREPVTRPTAPQVSGFPTEGVIEPSGTREGVSTSNWATAPLSPNENPPHASQQLCMPSPQGASLMRILVVEDERDLAVAIADSLRLDGYAIDIAQDASSALSLASVNTYDLVCLDLNLPDADGLDVCRQIAAGPDHSLDPGPPPKIIMLTARGRVQDRILGLDQGADDYLVKPFSLGELSARVRAVLRRDTQAGSSVISYAGIEMDTARQEVTYLGQPVPLSVKEFALLRWFLLHPEEVHSAERLLEHVWDEHADPFTNTVRMTISNLRRKLAQVGAREAIKTLPGRGYTLRAHEAA